MIIFENFQKQKPFDITAMSPRGTLGLCCVHIAQLMTHLAISTLPFTLYLCYKPSGILQSVTKSQEGHTSSHCKNFITSTLVAIGLKVFSERGYRNRSFLLPPLIFLRTIKNHFSGN